MIGEILNERYDVLEQLGDGTTATVYKAYDTQLNRIVALKVLLSHVPETTQNRFFQEAYAAAQLNHPNIMAIYDQGTDGTYHYLVTEYVEGKPLTEYIPSPPHVVAVLGKQIASALGYAHSQGIIHRDIKPSNIMVTSNNHIKIMDLGLALPPQAKRFTATGMVVGTPAYISPEQAQGYTLDARSDIYSLGVVLYEMGSGELPFSTDNIVTLILQHVRQPPPPITKWVPDFPPDLESIILKALEKQPVNRYQTTEQLESDLDEFLEEYDDLDDEIIPPIPSVETDQIVGIILADDHAMMRQMMANYLETHDEFIILGQAGDGESALTMTMEIEPDLLLLDLTMPIKGGIDILPEIRDHCPNVKVIVLSGYEDDAHMVRALRAGAHGYVPKSVSEKDLVKCIQRVMAGEVVLGTGGSADNIPQLLMNSPHHLGDDERKLLLLIAGGYTDEVIAQQLDMSLTTLQKTLGELITEFGAEDRNDAALKALRQGEILLEDLHNISLQ